MAENMAVNTLNIPNENFKRVYGEWAKGGWGLIMTGNVQVDPANLGGPEDLFVDHARLSDAKYLKAWKEWADVSTANGTVALVQSKF
jgi:2,4-dienoyl-CoA reductase-like NADH-dependent reductase (Old Yellow Enzyme family)